MSITDRFLKYVSFCTTSDDSTRMTPSTPGQMEFARFLVEELKQIGLQEVTLSDYGYVMATLPATTQEAKPVVGFIAHMDTSPDASGKNIHPSIKIAEDKDIDCITQTHVINYLWPDGKHNGILYLPPFSGNTTTIPYRENLREYYKVGTSVNPRDFKLPCIYHGVVRKKVLDVIMKERGCYINAISPDSYLAVVLSEYIHSQIEVDYPISIGGACVGSATVSNIKGGHFGELEDSEQYRVNVSKGYKWSENVPDYYSIQTIWADSAMHACRDENMRKMFSLEQLTARAIIENRSEIKFILSKTASFVEKRKISYNPLKTWLRLSALFMVKLRGSLTNRMSMKVIDNIGEIENVEKYIK